ncbi:hypothetical protein PPYR_06059 [Photinus pyralis]|uniref:RRM domain-containing protein n=2 Tax=Photinus pyralis TaxID=7054 RepID=A0A5N4ASN4_PHOPY|nr:A-kinase anchor protein 17A isoform X1 [Photinus pyralis]KAB0800319.1 hypothetical protein PPYR_06059 [Photinus pyralis]
MNTFQTCSNTSDAVPLYLSQQLYLKPIARLNISVQLPQKKMGKSISNWEVMEQLRYMIKPETFTLLKVTNTNLEFIRFEAEVEHKSKLQPIVEKINKRTIKLKEFPELLKIRSSEAKVHFPSRHDWDSFFREAKNMNEMKPGERPDTLHISNLPIKWFVPYHLSGEEDAKPSERMLYAIFEKFGTIRCVDIPICDPYRNKMKAEVSGLQTFTFDEAHYFEGYVQFKDYIGFTKAMDALRGMKLLHKEADDDAFAVNIVVDYDRTKHLSEASIRRREIVRDRLVRKDIYKEEKLRINLEEEEKTREAERQKKLDEKAAKQRRRQEREERRKVRIMAKLKVDGGDQINAKIAKEKKKLLKVQRKLEAIRLVEELFRRIKIKHEKTATVKNLLKNNKDELTRLKTATELEVNQRKEKLNYAIHGRVVLKSILGGATDDFKDDSSHSDSSISKRWSNQASKDVGLPHPAAVPGTSDWYGYTPVGNNLYPLPITPMYSNTGINNSYYLPYVPRGRGLGIYPRRGRARFRGGNRGRNSYPPDLQQQYYRYFEKFLHEHDDRVRRSQSRSRSRSRSRRSRSRSRGRRPRRSRSRSRSSSRSRRHRSSSSSHYERTPPARKRSRQRSRSERSSTKRKERSKSSSYRSIDSSKFISPSRLRLPHSRSRSRS